MEKKKWLVCDMQNLAALDTFNEEDEGPTQRLLETHRFETEEEAMKFYNHRKATLRVAGLGGQYVTYPAEVCRGS